jgi:hypothetical protein
MINQLVFESLNQKNSIKLGKYDSEFHKSIPENPNYTGPLDSYKNKHTVFVNGKKAGIVAVKDSKIPKCSNFPIWHIFIHPDHRGTGLLEKSAHALAKKYNKKELVAGIHTDHIASLKSHSKAWFARDHEKENDLTKKGFMPPDTHIYSKKF